MSSKYRTTVRTLHAVGRHAEAYALRDARKLKHDEKKRLTLEAKIEKWRATHDPEAGEVKT